MPEKKKTAKTAESSVSKPQGYRTSRLPGAGRVVAGRSGAAAVAQPLESEKQFRSFETAMKLFHARKFREAREAFAAAADGPERDVANRALQHAAMCDRRLEQPVVEIHSAEDHYNYGVALLNTRKLADARAHLERALELAPGVDHVHYALALALALGGNIERAYAHLEKAIEIEPRNRIIARQDADFTSLASQPPFNGLLYPQKKNQ
jgi:tetratricopeptide (TPR) repeat protein